MPAGVAHDIGGAAAPASRNGIRSAAGKSPRDRKKRRIYREKLPVRAARFHIAVNIRFKLLMQSLKNHYSSC